MLSLLSLLRSWILSLQQRKKHLVEIQSYCFFGVLLSSLPFCSLFERAMHLLNHIFTVYILTYYNYTQRSTESWLYFYVQGGEGSCLARSLDVWFFFLLFALRDLQNSFSPQAPWSKRGNIAVIFFLCWWQVLHHWQAPLGNTILEWGPFKKWTLFGHKIVAKVGNTVCLFHKILFDFLEWEHFFIKKIGCCLWRSLNFW